MKKTLLTTKDISEELGKDRGTVPVLDHASVGIYEDNFTIIMRPSGTGKSALLYVLSGVDRVSSGTVVYKGRVTSCFKESQMAKIHPREFDFVFQQTHLVNNLTLFENVTVAGYLGKERKPEETRKQVEALLERMNVGGAKDRMSAEVSDGKAQRVAAVRAMINEPGITFADEPVRTSNKGDIGEVLDLSIELNEEGQSTLMVTRGLRIVVHGIRLPYLEDGKILDELSVSVPHPKDGRTREAVINDWLTSFQW